MPRKTRRQQLDERIEALCEAKGLEFAPHEITPWEVDDGPPPYGVTSAGYMTWKSALRLRRQLIEELEAQDARAELPSDLDPEELNEMIGALAREKGLPHGIHPDLIGPDPSYHGYWGQGQEERHKQSVAWRRRLIAELAKRPEWIVEWRAAQDLDRRIRELCERKGLTFMPWEMPPWLAPDQLPEHIDTEFSHTYQASLPQAVRLRRQLIRELEGVE